MSKSMWYVFSRTLINRIKKAAKKPLTYVGLVGVILYALLIIGSFTVMIEDYGLDTAEGFTVLVSLVMFYILPASIIQYAKRKGIIFRQSEVHFIFAAPENPKLVILYAGIKNILGSLILGIVAVIFGLAACHVSVSKVVIYFLVAVLLEILIEVDCMIACYGNEKLPDRFFVVMKWLLYGMMGIFGLVAIWMLCRYGVSVNTMSMYLTFPVIQMIPLFGWELSCLQLILLGPTALNITGTVLYVLLAVGLTVYAVRMRCRGEYYEDAMKFADDYAERQSKAKKGQITFGKKKFRANVTMRYQGSYAKAIYYRQLLEYKKNRFFIFGGHSLLFFVVGIVLMVFGFLNGEDGGTFIGMKNIFVLPIVEAYLLVIFSAYATKWEKELENPYTFLIPDTPFRKMWYATRVEHIRAFADGCLLCVPAAIGIRLSPAYALLSVLLYVCLNANRLYLGMAASVVLGKNFGHVGIQLLRILAQTVVLVIAMIPTIVLGVLVSETAGFLAMLAVISGLTVVGAVLASAAFARMESRE